jgi:POT family proton-dependent oligopeptide transporter
MSVTVGNLFTAQVNSFIQNEDGTSKLEGASYYWFFVSVITVTGVLFGIYARFYKEKVYIQDEAPADENHAPATSDD